MKIKLLKVKNLKKIKELEIKPKTLRDNVIVIAGKNASGKTSVLDAILYGLTGGVGLKGVSKPIREGQEKAEVILEIDNFIVKRHWTNNETSYLSVINKEDGEKYSSPQAMLDSFLGKLTFDPLQFALFNSREQRDLLLETFGLKEKLEEIDGKKENLYEKRRGINREIKTYKGQLEGIKQPKKGLPKETTSISDLSKKLEKTKDYNNELEANKANFEKIIEKIIEYKKEIKELEKNKNVLKEYLEGKTLQDLDILRTAIGKAEKLNEEIRGAERYQELISIVRNKSKKATRMTNLMIALDESKLKLLKEKKVPFKGLSIEEEGVNFKGIPFNQLADSEKLKISMVMAMIMNPKLKVIRITDGSLLDDDNMKVVEKIAKRFDYQIWLERIAEDKFADIIMVDGEIEK